MGDITKPYKWRTIITSGEGTTVRYVDSATGSDLQGNGTMANPYQSLGKAFRTSGSKPSKIICRGRFSEMLADGNHQCEINGDYYGAAVFDGADYYLIYGFRHNNMIIVNTGVGTYDLQVATGSGALAGVGGAAAGHVGNATYVSGVAGSPVLLDRTSLYMGVIGGTSACKYLGFSRVKTNRTYFIQLGGYRFGLSHSTVYGCEITDRCKNTTGPNTMFSTIFANFAMIANDTSIKYTGCLFAVDARWYFLTGTNSEDGQVFEFVLEGSTSEERQASLLAQMEAKYIELGTPEGSRKYPVFEDCLFSTQTSAQLFNNPERLDFTLKLGSDGVINEYTYYGAFPPALNVPIMDNSTETPATWDEKTADGCIKVFNNTICLDETSSSMEGSILTKIVEIDPTNFPVNGIFGAYISKFTDYHAFLNQRDVTGAPYTAGQVLPIGRYIVKGAVIYNDINFANNSVIVVSQASTTFTNDNYESQLIPITEPNIMDVVYCRCRSMVYVNLTAAEGLQRGGTYLNTGNETITYHGRSIAPKESFVAVNNEETFTASSPDYTIGAMFDDTRVPAAEWVPAQMFGEYFVMKESGTIKLDADGVPVSSGNYLAWQDTAHGGYSDQLRKSIINQKYVQFAIFVNHYDFLG